MFFSNYIKERDMEIKLVKADIENAKEIHQMQIITFRPLLEKYQDFGSNPGNEKIERTIKRNHNGLLHYKIKWQFCRRNTD
jgi:hypothetical protein